MNVRALVVPLLLLLAVSAQAGEKFYKWKDEGGAWHYTRTPPPAGAQAQNVEVHGSGTSAGAAGSPASGAPAGGTTAAPAGTPAPGATPVPGNGNLSVASTSDRKAQCEKAKAYAKTMSENSYVAVDRDGDGQPELMDDATKKKETERAQLAVKLACE